MSFDLTLALCTWQFDIECSRPQKLFIPGFLFHLFFFRAPFGCSFDAISLEKPLIEISICPLHIQWMQQHRQLTEMDPFHMHQRNRTYLPKKSRTIKIKQYAHFVNSTNIDHSKPKYTWITVQIRAPRRKKSLNWRYIKHNQGFLTNKSKYNLLPTLLFACKHMPCTPYVNDCCIEQKPTKLNKTNINKNEMMMMMVTQKNVVEILRFVTRNRNDECFYFERA